MIRTSTLALCLFGAFSLLRAQPAASDVIMQGFYWNSNPGDITSGQGIWWDTLTQTAPELAECGFKTIWTPPANKGFAGVYDMGYGIYDYYEYGSLLQKGTVRTRHGSDAQLRAMIDIMHQHGLLVMADVVLNHRAGAENQQPEDCDHDNNGLELRYTEFRPASGRLPMDAQNFHPSDHHCDLNGPYHDRSFFEDICYFNLIDNVLLPGPNNGWYFGPHNLGQAGDSLIIWGRHLIDEMGFDEIRLDAVKHIEPGFLAPFLVELNNGQQPFAVGELFDSDLNTLKGYRDQVETFVTTFGTGSKNANLSIFDFNLRYALRDMANGNGGFDMWNLNSRGLRLGANMPGEDIVTFVENHDVDRIGWEVTNCEDPEVDEQVGETCLKLTTDSGHDPIFQDKHMAYAYIMAAEGRPSVFWKDWYWYNLDDDIKWQMALRRYTAGGSSTPISSLSPFFVSGHGGDLHVLNRNGFSGQPGMVLTLNDNPGSEHSAYVNTPFSNMELKDYSDAFLFTQTAAFGDSRAFVKASPRNYAWYAPTGLYPQAPGATPSAFNLGNHRGAKLQFLVLRAQDAAQLQVNGAPIQPGDQIAVLPAASDVAVGLGRIGQSFEWDGVHDMIIEVLGGGNAGEAKGGLENGQAYRLAVYDKSTGTTSIASFFNLASNGTNFNFTADRPDSRGGSNPFPLTANRDVPTYNVGSISLITSFGASQLALKTIDATSETFTSDTEIGTTGDERPLAIGEVITYRLQSRLPESTTISFELEDALAAELAYVTGSARVSYQANTMPSFNGAFAGIQNESEPTFSFPAGFVQQSGGTLTFNFGSIINNDGDQDEEFIIVEFDARVTNDVDNSAGDIFGNSYTRIIDEGLPTENIVSSNEVFNIIYVPELMVTKSLNAALSSPAGGPFTSGDVIVFDIEVTSTAGDDRTSAFDIQLVDVLDSRLAVASVEVVSPPAYLLQDADNSGGQTIDLTYNELRPGDSFILRLTLDVQEGVCEDDELSNEVDLYYTSLPGEAPDIEGEWSEESTATADLVEDDAPPTAACKDISVSVSLDGNGDAAIQPSDVDDGSTACGEFSLSVMPNTFICADIGDVTVTLTITDVSTNATDDCTATVTVEDNQAPTAICQDITVQLDGNGQATIDEDAVNNGSIDNCLASLSFDTDDNTFNCDDLSEPVTVTLTVTDAGTNESTCTADVTVEDGMAPTAICQDITVQLDGNGQATIAEDAVNNGSTDNCPASLSFDTDDTTFNCDDLSEPVTVTLTVTDAGTNESTCTADVTVEDGMAPTAICQDITVQLAGNGQATIDEDAVNNGSTDNCLASLSFDTDDTTFNCDDLNEPVTVTLTVTDAGTNESTCTAEVTVEDGMAPTAICQNITVQLDGNGEATIDEDAVNNGSTDNCPAGLSFDTNDTTFDCDDLNEPVTVILTVTDAGTNESTCTADVTVEDNAAPTAQCRDVTLDLTSDGTTILDPSAVDDGSNTACGTFSLGVSPNLFDCDDIGEQFMVTLTITDDSNAQTDDCTATVTVADPESYCCAPPAAVCQNTTVQLNAQGQATLSPAQVDGGSTADCGLQSLTVSPYQFNCSNIGSNTVTLTITDLNNESDDCTATVTVQDATPPTVNCSSGTVTFNGQASFPTSSAVTVTSSDICGVASTTYSPTTITCSQVGQNVPVIVTVTDVNGNVAQCTTSVQVNGFPCGFMNTGGIGCSSQAGYNAANKTFTLQTNNCNNNNPYTDNQGFIGYQLCGNGSISFRVASVSSTQVFAGISLRASTAPGAIKAEVVQNLYFTARASVRTVTNGAAWPQNQFLSGQPWMRLDRQGNQVNIYTSADGLNWNIFLSRTLTLPNCVQVGMLAYGPGANTATFDNVTVIGGSALQTGGGGFSLEEPSTVHRLPSTALRVYPNPTSGQVTVELPVDLTLEQVTLEVFDAYGRSVLREAALDYHHQLDLSRLPAGAYWVRLRTEVGEWLVERVVLQPRP